MQPVIPVDLVAAVRSARAVVALTGAGISAESGIPTFRDAMEGLWARYDPSELASPEAFDANPELVTRWYDWRRQGCAMARPNAGHVALAGLQSFLEQSNCRFTLVTQNVDRLHQAAGSRDVIELHGTLWLWRCVQCGDEQEERGGSFPSYPPRCGCGGNRRPCVVWFGERLPEKGLGKAFEMAASCDLFFSVGTSAQVYPAALLPWIARQRGARVAEINPQTTPLTEQTDWFLAGKAGEILPVLVKAISTHFSEHPRP